MTTTPIWCNDCNHDTHVVQRLWPRHPMWCNYHDCDAPHGTMTTTAAPHTVQWPQHPIRHKDNNCDTHTAQWQRPQCPTWHNDSNGGPPCGAMTAMATHSSMLCVLPPAFVTYSSRNMEHPIPLHLSMHQLSWMLIKVHIDSNQCNCIRHVFPWPLFAHVVQQPQPQHHMRCNDCDCYATTHGTTAATATQYGVMTPNAVLCALDL
jgi:hypothetical protein